MATFPFEQYLQSLLMQQQRPLQDIQAMGQIAQTALPEQTMAYKQQMQQALSKYYQDRGYQPMVNGQQPNPQQLGSMTMGKQVPGGAWQAPQIQPGLTPSKQVVAGTTYERPSTASQITPGPDMVVVGYYKDGSPMYRSMRDVVFADPRNQTITQAGKINPNARLVSEQIPLEEQLKKQVQTKELSSLAGLLPKLGQAETAINNLEQQYYRGYTPPSVQKGDIGGGVAARASGLGQRAVAGMGANAEMQTYLNDRAAFSSLISKGGFMEAGMLTNQDIQRVLNALPTPGDTEQESTAKWRELKKILGDARNRFQNLYKQYTNGEYQQGAQQQPIDADPMGLFK